ncbi:hypothetical protein LCGC14_1599070, partial [marine sediment metagenome]
LTTFYRNTYEISIITTNNSKKQKEGKLGTS